MKNLLCEYWGCLVEACQDRRKRSVVTQTCSDRVRVFALICPTPRYACWAFRCWPDQKPVHPLGV